jgi:hypothetical protein
MGMGCGMDLLDCIVPVVISIYQEWKVEKEGVVKNVSNCGRYRRSDRSLVYRSDVMRTDLVNFLLYEASSPRTDLLSPPG